MSLLDHPETQALLADAVVTLDAVRDRGERLTAFLQRHPPRFYRAEQRATSTLVIRGRLGGLERKTSEPTAIEAGLPRKPIPFFVGAGKWDDEAVMAELRAHVSQELGAPDGEVVVAGPDAGNVWFFDMDGVTPSAPRCRFVDWYEGWLKETLRFREVAPGTLDPDDNA